MGYLTGKATYHDVMPAEVIDRLKKVYTPTALYIRGRADRIAVHRERDVVFEWECKTCFNRNARNLCLEALPVIHHLNKVCLGVDCLYVYKPADGLFNVGFWVSALPPVRCVQLPPRWQGRLREFLKKSIRCFFPDVDLVETARDNGGSGDPFLVINEADVKRLPCWVDLVEPLAR